MAQAAHTQGAPDSCEAQHLKVNSYEADGPGSATTSSRRCIWCKQGQGEAIMTTNARIEVNPQVMLGKPVIKGTRITVELILRKLSEGAEQAELLDAYPGLTSDDVQAALSR